MASIKDDISSSNIRILKMKIAVPGTFRPRDVNLGLMQAAKLGHVECAQCLLEAGADKDFESPNGYTPVQTAIQNRKPAIVNLLISYGASVSFRGGISFTPLHMAAKNGIEEIAEVLISRGTSVNCRDSSGNTPLILAAKYGQYLVMRTLIDAGCDLNAADKDGCTALHYACHRARGFQSSLTQAPTPTSRTVTISPRC